MSGNHYTIDDLLHVMIRLRNPESGCPWDVQQDHVSLAPFTLEEAYEVVDAIERNDVDHLPEELGDLLFQVIFHAQVGSENGTFDFSDVVHVLVAKLIARHPHVFPSGSIDSARALDSEISHQEISANWEKSKQYERNAKGRHGLLDDIPAALPALTRAQKVQKRVSKVGFDWESLDGVLEKLREEIGELEDELASGSKAFAAEELGDLFFTLVNLARHMSLDAESVLRNATAKFERRFNLVEQYAAEENHLIPEMDQASMDRLWLRAKQSTS